MTVLQIQLFLKETALSMVEIRRTLNLKSKNLQNRMLPRMNLYKKHMRFCNHIILEVFFYKNHATIYSQETMETKENSMLTNKHVCSYKKTFPFGNNKQ